MKTMFSRTSLSLVLLCFWCMVLPVFPLFSAPAAAPKKSSTLQTAAAKPGLRHLTAAEIEAKGIYPAMEAVLYRMCIREVPFFLALHKCYYRDPSLGRGDTLMITGTVIQTLLSRAAVQFGEHELTASPVTNIDSMMIFRYRGKNKKSTACNIIIYARADAYEIPKTGAKIRVPPKIKGTVVYNPGSGAMTVTLFSSGIRLELPGYAKKLSLGFISDMDIRYAELFPKYSAFEARLMYAAKEKEVTRRGWSLNITECNKIRPYSR